MSTTRHRVRGTLVAAAATAPLLLAPLALPASAAGTSTLIPKPWPPQMRPAPVVKVDPSWQFQIGRQVDKTSAASQGVFDLSIFHRQVPVKLVWSAGSRPAIAGYDLYRYNPSGSGLTKVATATKHTSFLMNHTDTSVTIGPIARTLYPTFKLVATSTAGRTSTVDPIRRGPVYSEQETGSSHQLGRSVFTSAPEPGPGWTRRTGAEYDAGAVLATARRGATLRIPVSTHAGQWVALEMTTGPRLGAVEVQVDGHRVGVVDTYARTRTPRVLVAQYKLTAGRHTVTLVNFGGQHRTTVELDGVFASD